MMQARGYRGDGAGAAAFVSKPTPADGPVATIRQVAGRLWDAPSVPVPQIPV